MNRKWVLLVGVEAAQPAGVDGVQEAQAEGAARVGIEEAACTLVLEA